MELHPTIKAEVKDLLARLEKRGEGEKERGRTGGEVLIMSTVYWYCNFRRELLEMKFWSE